MDVTTTLPSTPATSPAATTTSEPVINSDFETFLKMLTAQLQNQDPLNPLDSQDFAVQLATFSSVEQAVQTNDLLKDLSAKLSSSNLSQLGSLIGREVRVTAATEFSGKPISVIPTVDPSALRSELVIRDANGAEMERFILDDTTKTNFTWTGLNPDGAFYPWGNYSFHVVDVASDLSSTETQAQVYATVKEARLSGNDIKLVLPGGIIIDETAVTAMRDTQ